MVMLHFEAIRYVVSELDLSLRISSPSNHSITGGYFDMKLRIQVYEDNHLVNGYYRDLIL